MGVQFSTEVVLYSLLVAVGVLDILIAPVQKRYYLLGSNLTGHLAIATVLAFQVPEDLIVKATLFLGTFCLLQVVLFGTRYWEHWPGASQRQPGLVKKRSYWRALVFLSALTIAANMYGLDVLRAGDRSLMFWVLVAMLGLILAAMMVGLLARWLGGPLSGKPERRKL